MLSGAIARWFDPAVPQEDRFLPPDFSLGQFFYSAETARSLVDRLSPFERICCLCTPRLAWEWTQRGREVRLLDYDTRFRDIPGFRSFDLTRPESPGETYDLVVFDPVFLPARQLERAVTVVVGEENRTRTALFMTFPSDREVELLGAFAAYDLRQIAFPLRYNHVRRDSGEIFRLYGNRDLPDTNESAN